MSDLHISGSFIRDYFLKKNFEYNKFLILFQYVILIFILLKFAQISNFLERWQPSENNVY